MNYSLSNILGRSKVAGPVISGTEFPAETLTSTRTGQWYADGVAISGENSSTYVVRLSDIGKAITQSTSNTITIWHPQNIAGVARFWSSLSNVFTSVSPDVLATDGQAVRRWTGIISGTAADQSTGVSQPLYCATGQSGNPSIEFDGSNDYFIPPAPNNVLRNVAQGYLIAGCRDTAPTGSAATHTVAYYTTNLSGFPRLGLFSRLGSNKFSAAGRLLDGGTTVTADSPTSNNSNYNVLAAHGDYSNGFMRLRVNGSVVASTSLGGSGNTSDTDSALARIGVAGIAEYFPGHLTCFCIVNASITATELSQIERYIGLFGGLNIPLV
jgi:hypothetical protein